MQIFLRSLQPVAEEAAQSVGLKVYEITLRPEKGGRVLRVNLDGDVTLDRCSVVSRAVSKWLDENGELVPYERYSLEVSSLGFERPLKGYEEFSAYKGKLVQLTTKAADLTGRKRYKGRIKEVSNQSLTLYIAEESAEFTIELENISKANLCIDMEKIK